MSHRVSEQRVISYIEEPGRRNVVETDILHTAARGVLLTPWYYLPFVLHFAVLSLVAIFTNKPAVYRWITRYFLFSIAVWAFVVRRFLA